MFYTFLRQEVFEMFYTFLRQEVYKMFYILLKASKVKQASKRIEKSFLSF